MLGCVKVDFQLKFVSKYCVRIQADGRITCRQWADVFSARDTPSYKQPLLSGSVCALWL